MIVKRLEKTVSLQYNEFKLYIAGNAGEIEVLQKGAETLLSLRQGDRVCYL